jgi:hypothetical protein
MVWDSNGSEVFILQSVMTQCFMVGGETLEEHGVSSNFFPEYGRSYIPPKQTAIYLPD